MKITLQEKAKIHQVTSKKVHKFIITLQAMKVPDAQSASGKRLGKIEKIPAWQLTKVKSINKVR